MSDRKPQVYIPFEFTSLGREEPQNSSWLTTIITLGLTAVALLACYAAARPISAIEPEQLLRDDG
jgi:hypothetical protein